MLKRHVKCKITHRSSLLVEANITYLLPLPLLFPSMLYWKITHAHIKCSGVLHINQGGTRSVTLAYLFMCHSSRNKAGTPFCLFSGLLSSLPPQREDSKNPTPTPSPPAWPGLRTVLAMGAPPSPRTPSAWGDLWPRTARTCSTKNASSQPWSCRRSSVSRKTTGKTFHLQVSSGARLKRRLSVNICVRCATLKGSRLAR